MTWYHMDFTSSTKSQLSIGWWLQNKIPCDTRTRETRDLSIRWLKNENIMWLCDTKTREKKSSSSVPHDEGSFRNYKTIIPFVADTLYRNHQASSQSALTIDHVTTKYVLFLSGFGELNVAQWLSCISNDWLLCWLSGYGSLTGCH